jgi:hypothetical protein
MFNVARVVVLLMAVAVLVTLGAHAVEAFVGAMQAMQTTMSKY